MDKKLECTDCGRKFVDGYAFSDHFQRAEGSVAIVGCNDRNGKPVKQRK